MSILRCCEVALPRGSSAPPLRLSRWLGTPPEPRLQPVDSRSSDFSQDEGVALSLVYVYVYILGFILCSRNGVHSSRHSG